MAQFDRKKKKKIAFYESCIRKEVRYNMERNLCFVEQFNDPLIVYSINGKKIEVK
jgi:hypothetical protein